MISSRVAGMRREGLRKGAVLAFTFVALMAITGMPGCDRSEDRKLVTLYCSVDEPFARQIVSVFEEQSGFRVLLKTDMEAGKTTGLVRRIEGERSHPQADVFWSSELFNTIQLARDGLLAEYRPSAPGIPDRYRDPAGRWTAFGLRARVLAYNTKQVDRDDLPKDWRGIVDAKWQGRLGVADPRFGTTLGHFAAFLALWGEPEYVTFLDGLNQVLDGRLMDGNATAAKRVGSGELLICATDTDDVYARRRNGEPVEMIYPDMGDGGTLLIPNSVGLIANGPHPEAARRLIDFLTSEQVERLLAESDSGNFPVRESLRNELGISLPAETGISFDRIADVKVRAISLAAERLIH